MEVRRPLVIYPCLLYRFMPCWGLWRLSGPFRAGSHQPCRLSYDDTAGPLQCCSETAGKFIKAQPLLSFLSCSPPRPLMLADKKGSYLSIPNPEIHTQHLSRLQSPCPASAGMVSAHTHTHTHCSFLNKAKMSYWWVSPSCWKKTLAWNQSGRSEAWWSPTFVLSHLLTCWPQC